MRVHELMQRDVATCTPQSTCAQAARLMWENDCGSIPVVSADDERLIGMVTDRDICMAAWTNGSDLESIPVETAMSHDALCCNQGDDVARVHQLMRESQIRRVPVIDQDRRVRGLVSLNDLAVAADGARRGRDEMLEVARTLAAVCRHRQPA